MLEQDSAVRYLVRLGPQAGWGRHRPPSICMAGTNLVLQNIAPIGRADGSFGDLPTLVGPQAIGKSIVLQFSRRLPDTGSIFPTLCKHGLHRDKDDSIGTTRPGRGDGAVLWLEVHPVSSDHGNGVWSNFPWLRQWLGREAPLVQSLSRHFR